jgi:hypothetical protein
MRRVGSRGAGSAANNIRGQVSNSTGGVIGTFGKAGKASKEAKLKNVRQHIRKMPFYDVFIFIIIFLTVLFRSLENRSIVFNVTVGITLFLKVFLAAFFYRQKTLGAFRVYFLSRYAYNLCVFCPILVGLKRITVTYMENYFIAGGLLLGLELALGGAYMRYLFKKGPEEAFEDIPGVKVT